ncbi:MAG: glycosyltransferase family 39 protein [Alphaproteobacteria bacterium]|nr:glycosyltransferase family 39 protein [Alphaproteobacteria bacterium]
MSDSTPATQPRYLDRLARHPVPVLVLLCLLAWLPGLVALPPLDRDESRFAQASKQMIESGNYVDIRFSTVPRYNKPVGIYWAQAAATRTFGHPPFNQIWTYRLPSLLGGILAVLLTYWSARAFASRETALLAGALLALTVALSAEAQMATTDALLLATIVAAQGFLLRTYLFARGRLPSGPTLATALACWATIGAGVLMKGPVLLVVVALTALAICLWDRDWRWLLRLRFAWGIPVALAVVLPWAIAIAFASHGAFYQRSLGHDFAAKILTGQESHGAPPGYYLALFSVTFWPSTLFALPAIGAAVVQRAQPPFCFLLAWIVPNWLLFEFVPTKLPHYILPVYPALAMIVACWIAGASAIFRWERTLRGIGAAQFMVVALAAVAGIAILPIELGSSINTVPTVIATAIFALAGATIVLTVRCRNPTAAGCALVAALLLYPLLSAVVAPALDPIWMSRTIAAHARADSQRSDPPIILAGYVEPSLVFLLGTDTRLETGKVAGVTAARQGGIAIVEDRDRKGFLQSLRAAGGKERPIDQVTGIDYSRGKREHVTFFRIAPAPGDISPPPE